MSVVKIPPKGSIIHPDLHLSGYVLLERIGHGGEAIVYSAWDVRRERVVAIKYLFIEDDLAKYSASIEREASILGELDHPNISLVYEFGKITNFTYLIMPYYPLKTLANLIEGKPLPAGVILAIAEQIAGALDYIHAKSIVHRDLKPTNVMIDSRNSAYLADFGVAKPLVDSTRMLHTGHGTSGYAPPEQHTRAPVSPKSDIYSFGVLLYQMFTGELPWGGEAPLAIRQLDARIEIPDPRESNSSIPEDVAGALRKITAIDPNDRPATASEAFRAVAGAFNEPGEENPTTGNVPAAKDSKERPEKTESRVESQIFHDALFLFEKARDRWDQGPEVNVLTQTDFAFVGSVYSSEEEAGLNLNEADRRFLLSSAIVNDFHQDEWWQLVPNAQSRWQVCERIILNGNEEAVERALLLLLDDPSQMENLNALTLPVVSRLVALAKETESEAALAFLDAMLAPAAAWQAACFSKEIDASIGRLAREDAIPAEITANLIAKMRSKTAAGELWGGDARSLPPILAVRQAAGSLPSSLPFALRARVMLELVGRQLLAAPNQLLRAYLASAAGSAAALGFHVYATFRSPVFLDQTRILNTLGNALLFGPLIGLGIFLTKLIVRRPMALSGTARLVLGILIGALVINFGFFSYHILFLNAAPVGWLVAFGALMIAAGVGLGAGLLHAVWMRVALGAGMTALGIGVPWGLTQLTGFTPLLYYEQNQSLQTGILIVVFSFLLSAIGQLADLTGES